MTEVIEAEPQVVSQAKYAARRVVNNLLERGEEVTNKAALSTLAVLDAESSYTADFGSDELDDFLDEFEAGVTEEVKRKQETKDGIQKRAEGGDNDTEE